MSKPTYNANFTAEERQEKIPTYDVINQEKREWLKDVRKQNIAAFIAACKNSLALDEKQLTTVPIPGVFIEPLYKMLSNNFTNVFNYTTDFTVQPTKDGFKVYAERINGDVTPVLEVNNKTGSVILTLHSSWFNNGKANAIIVDKAVDYYHQTLLKLIESGKLDNETSDFNLFIKYSEKSQINQHTIDHTKQRIAHYNQEIKKACAARGLNIDVRIQYGIPSKTNNYKAEFDVTSREKETDTTKVFSLCKKNLIKVKEEQNTENTDSPTIDFNFK